MELEKERVVKIVKAALKEDIGRGDITTESLIVPYTDVDAAIVTKEECIICGLQVAEWTIGVIDYSVRFKPMCREGASVGKGAEVAILQGRAASILKAERTMLNFLSILSGIATRTGQFVDAAKPCAARILDTRKTLPLLRYLEKYAVSVGGGRNHRMGLYDQVLIKDNHIKAYSKQRELAKTKKQPEKHGNTLLAEMIKQSRKKAPKDVSVEIEVTSIEEFREALSAEPDSILLDNMRLADVRACVELRRRSSRKPLLEVSGGITLETVKGFAQSGVDLISVGSLTGSVRSIDMSLEIV